jgi:hypothetical protein
MGQMIDVRTKPNLLPAGNDFPWKKQLAQTSLTVSSMKPRMFSKNVTIEIRYKAANDMT